MEIDVDSGHKINNLNMVTVLVNEVLKGGQDSVQVLTVG